MLPLGSGGLSRRDESMVPKESFHLVSTCARSPFSQSSPTRPPVDTTQISPLEGYGSDVSKSFEARFQPSGVRSDPSAMNFSYRLTTSSVGFFCDLGTWAVAAIIPRRTIRTGAGGCLVTVKELRSLRRRSAITAKDRLIPSGFLRYHRRQAGHNPLFCTDLVTHYLCALTHSPTTN